MPGSRQGAGHLSWTETGTVTDETLTRLRLDISYDGTDFSGWAEQPGRRTVQGELQAALARVLRIPTPQLTVAGRTDAGVHARGQVAHVDVPASVWEAEGERLLRRLAGVLPPDVRVTAVAPAPPGFDARFSALVRRYVYRVSDAPGGVDPLRRHEVLWHRRPLDVDRMNEAAAALLGEHDFAAYCRKREGASTVRSPAFEGGGRASTCTRPRCKRTFCLTWCAPCGGAARGGTSHPRVACSSAPGRGTRFGGAREPRTASRWRRCATRRMRAGRTAAATRRFRVLERAAE